MSASCSLVRGNEMANSGHYDVAIDLFTKAIKLDPAEFRYDTHQFFSTGVVSAACTHCKVCAHIVKCAHNEICLSCVHESFLICRITVLYT